MTTNPVPRSAADSARSAAALADTLARAEAQLDGLGDTIEAATVADLRLRIAVARRELNWLRRNGVSGIPPEIAPFWRKFLDP